MKVEVLKSFQLSGTPPHLRGEVFTVSSLVGRRLIRKGLVKEIVEPKKIRRKCVRQSDNPILR